MNKFLLTIAAAGVLTVQAKSLQLKDIVEGRYMQKSVSEFRSMSDGEHYTAADDDHSRIVMYSYKSGQPVDTLFDAATARDCPFRSFDDYTLSQDEKKILFSTDSEKIYRRSFKALYYTFEIKRNLIKPLSDAGKQQAAVFSPNGRMVAFVRDNNIFLKKLDYGTESQVTQDGEKNKIINGIPDWVYEEEFSMNSAMVWSPDNSHLAFLRFDESAVKEYPMQMFRGDFPAIDSNELYPGEFSYKYPVAGEVNSKVEVFTFNIDSRRITKMNLQVDSQDYIPRIRFTVDPQKMAVMTFNRHQSLFSLNIVNPASGVSNVILQDKNDCYINPDNMDCIQFFEDGFTFMSEKSGFRHLYYYNQNGTLLRQVTSGEWDVTDFYGYDASTKSFYFQAAKESPLQRGIYKVNAKGVITQLSSEKGFNQAHFSCNYRYFQNYYSNANLPLLVTLNNASGKTLRTLEDNSLLKNELASLNVANKEFFSFKTSQGVTLNGYMIKPVGFDTAKKYPVLMHQYSGPGSQQALDKWMFDWLYYMPANDIVVVCVDGRGTGARGAEFEREVYLSLGVKESQDQAEGARYLSTLPFVDVSRIAIWGWSFGGYNTLMSLLTSDVFKLGMAVAPVTDWKFYDSVYTERYMRTPKENYDGYQAASLLPKASALKSRLLIVSGTADDNVHPQNTYELTESFVQNDVDFDMHVYTNRNHFIKGGNTRYHLYKKLYNYLKNNL